MIEHVRLDVVLVIGIISINATLLRWIHSRSLISRFHDIVFDMRDILFLWRLLLLASIFLVFGFEASHLVLLFVTSTVTCSGVLVAIYLLNLLVVQLAQGVHVRFIRLIWKQLQLRATAGQVTYVLKHVAVLFFCNLEFNF